MYFINYFPASSRKNAWCILKMKICQSTIPCAYFVYQKQQVSGGMCFAMGLENTSNFGANEFGPLTNWRKWQSSNVRYRNFPMKSRCKGGVFPPEVYRLCRLLFQPGELNFHGGRGFQSHQRNTSHPSLRKAVAKWVEQQPQVNRWDREAEVITWL
jgi:hypothetical protein